MTGNVRGGTRPEAVPEISNSVDQSRGGRRRAEVFRRLGGLSVGRGAAVVASWRTSGGGRSGPYYRVAYRESGRQRSIYLGADPLLADEVRAELDRRRAEMSARRRFARARAALRRGLALRRAEWDGALRAVGLYLKGGEVRGWRSRKAAVAWPGATE